MIRTLASAALALTLLAGCGGDAAPGNERAAAAAANDQAAGGNESGDVRIRNRHQEELLALPDNLRRVGLVRAIRQTGNSCPLRVEPNPVHQGEYEGMALWTARCDNNKQYAIFIAPNGDVQVRDCEDMAELGLPACHALPPAAPTQPRRARTAGELKTD